MAKHNWQEIEDWHAASGMDAKKTAAHFGISINTLRAHLKRILRGEKQPAGGANQPAGGANQPASGANQPAGGANRGANTAENAPQIPQNAPQTPPNAPQNHHPLTAEQILGSAPLTKEPEPRRCLSIKLPRAIVARCVSEIIPGGTLFRHAENYVTVDPYTTRPGYRPLRQMDDARFTTWIETYICWKQTAAKDAQDTSISDQQAKFILRSDIMRERTPEILEVSPVRLPLMHRTGSKVTFTPAPIGLDETTGIYTQDSLPIDWDHPLPIRTCMQTLEKLLQDFPFDGKDETFLFCKSRSAAAAVTAMLGQFLHHSIRKFPMILSLANKSGTGKSFLLETILAPVHGPVDPTNYNTDESEMRKTLNTKLLDGAYYCYLDDIPSLTNNTINRYVTSNNCITDRILGTNTSFSLPNRMQFFITGNNLKTAADIVRRALTLDLHYAGLIRERKIESPAVTPAHFRDPAWRTDLLQILWSLCCHWQQQGCPRPCTTYPSDFEDYATAAHIAMAAGLADPWGPRQIALDTGDARGEALEDLIIAAADTIQEKIWSTEKNTYVHTGATKTFTSDDMVEIARANGLLEIIIPPSVDKARSLGMALRPLKGDIRTDTSGRQFRVGDKHARTRNLTLITILSEPSHAPADSTGTAPEDPAPAPPADPSDDPFAPLPSVELPL